MKSGAAIVRVRGGRVYEGIAQYDGCAVTFDGRLRVVSGFQTEPEVTYRGQVSRTWPITEIVVVEWLES